MSHSPPPALGSLVRIASPSGILLFAFGFWICVSCIGNCSEPPSPAINSMDQAPPAESISINANGTNRFRWPTWEQWKRVLTLRDYNTRIVIFCTTLLGCAAGVIGSFTLLRRRALMGDAISHATLPGIGIAFMLAVAFGFSSKSLLTLLIGATVTGLIGVAIILLVRNLTHLKEDTALGAVLSVFFGAGIALLGVIQQMKEGHAAGLESFIYGKTASMGSNDAMLIGITALVSIVICALFVREFKLLCFDDQYAGSAGYPVLFLDFLLMGLVVAVTIVGLQAVGLILMIALMVIPAAAARFWTQRMKPLILIAAILGASSGMTGAIFSAVFPRLPSGAMIVLICSFVFLVSLMIGIERGVIIRWWRRRSLNQSIAKQHLLRAMYEIVENRLGLEAMADQSDAEELAENITVKQLMSKRSWTYRVLRKELRRAERDGQVLLSEAGARFAQSGLDEAERLTRQHRLWELYLINYADVATSRVDRDADAIEHVLEPETIVTLENLLEKRFPQFPASPHNLDAGTESVPMKDTGGGRG